MSQVTGIDPQSLEDILKAGMIAVIGLRFNEVGYQEHFTTQVEHHDIIAAGFSSFDGQHLATELLKTQGPASFFTLDGVAHIFFFQQHDQIGFAQAAKP